MGLYAICIVLYTKICRMPIINIYTEMRFVLVGFI